MIFRSRRLLWRLATHGCLLGLITSVASAQQFTIRKVAVNGDQAPGAAAGVVYAPIQQTSIGGRPDGPAINLAGDVGFISRLAGPNVSGANDVGMWLGSPGKIELLMREGSSAPGFHGQTFTEPALATTNAAGESVFAQAAAATPTALWFGRPGQLALLARAQTQAPGTASAWTSFGPMAINSAGAAFFGFLPPTVPGTLTQNSGYWTGLPGNVGLVTQTTSQAPGTAAGITFVGFGQSVAVNAAGRVVFAGSVTMTGPTDQNTQGLWSGVPGDVTLVARKGDPVRRCLSRPYSLSSGARGTPG